MFLRFPIQIFKRIHYYRNMAEKNLVFVYGTLKSGEPNYDILTNEDNGICNYIGKAKTYDKWPLVIASRYNIPFLLYAKNKGKHVIGELYLVDDVMLKKMDELECHPTYYERKEENVQVLESKDKTYCTDGKTLKPWIYFLTEYKSYMMELPHLEEYSSEGSHGLKYVSRYNRTGPPYILECKNIQLD
ncbi:gamma-glutamylaminecyclotransferase-like isoform X1 [Centruroides sculpturatus]|uniref:gamma-glutamylaminecyclotransferase-like isoform X1 n=2 Tax=Centruroides sculpturatus TaxID=218467 RepID=UPI000C6CF21F|nr:gamma-glutamylaminecyclotransferase-like isoform X1 [Centruroides sculpturatus]XP_023215998.1 gamma-glutamylaminecyclotransferase-like isoform X1 [Centruroides sculpturatus]XP_023215999.1 gamma-glutamylaminecyclotransferase-like isoform X1 [Centruroides sculpturatus]